MSCHPAAQASLLIAAGGTVTAQELGDLDLRAGLHHQPDAALGDPLEDLTELTLGIDEQVSDLVPDTVSCG